MLPPTTERGATITRSGDWILIAPLSTTHSFDAFAYSLETASGKRTTVNVRIPIAAEAGPGANILAIAIQEGVLRLTFAGIPGRTYDVEFSPAGAPFDWTVLGAATVGPDGVAQFDTTYPGGAGGFFRTVSR